MTTAYTSLLGLALPVTGELSGTWGETVNTAITSLLDTAVAGTTSITTDADITLTTTTGASNQARQAIILWNPASGTTTRNITAPAQSKIYTVINASGGTQSIVIRGVGPTTGVTIAKGESATVAWNGSDFVKVGSSGGAITFTDLTVTGNTILGDAAADTLTVNATSTFNAPVSFAGLVRLPSTGRSAAAALTTTNPAFLYGVASTYTDTTSSGTIAAIAPFYSIARPTLSTSNVTTYTNAATLYIANSPATGGSATITNPYALYVAAGANYFGGALNVDGLATFNADISQAVFTGATQAAITLQKTGTSGFQLYTGTAGQLSFYNVNNSRTEATLNASGLIVGQNIGSEVAAVPLNVYNANVNGELLRLEGLGNRTGWNGFSFWTAGVANRHARFTQSGTLTKIEPYETSTGNLATDGSFNVNFNTFSFYNYNSTVGLLVGDSTGIGVGTGTIQSVTGGKALSLGAYLNLYSFSGGIGGMNQNAYYDSVWKFTSANYSTIYQTSVSDGSHIWYSSTAAGSIGSAISYVQLMTLNRDSRLIVGTGTTFGNQALTTPGINISNAAAVSATITLADGASGSTDSRLLFGNTTSSYGALRMVFNSTSSISLDAVTWGNTATTKNLVLNTNGGNVGIQTTTPGSQLEIGGTNPEIRLGPVAATSGAYMSYNTASNYFSLNAVTQGVGYRDLVFANDGGGFAVGIISPITTGSVSKSLTSAKTHIYFSTTANSNSTAFADQRTTLFVDLASPGTNNEYATSALLINNYSGLASNPGASIRVYNQRFGGSNDPLRVFEVNYLGNIGLGDTNASTSGNGITFPATQGASSNANTLDDYEEGTFTPTFNTANGDLTGFGYSVQFGRYTKVGNTVQVFISLATINAASISGTGNVVINGLPFTIANQSNGVNALALTHDARWTTQPSFAQSQASAVSLTLYKNNLIQSGGSSALQVTDFTATNLGNFNIVTVMFVYFVD
jgi:hypothetical protein